MCLISTTTMSSQNNFSSQSSLSNLSGLLESQQEQHLNKEKEAQFMEFQSQSQSQSQDGNRDMNGMNQQQEFPLCQTQVTGQTTDSILLDVIKELQRTIDIK